jgi:hypothetical protein
MPLGAQVRAPPVCACLPPICARQSKRTPSLLGLDAPLSMCAPWVLLSPLRLIYVHWGLIYAPWGSIIPLGAQVHAPPYVCVPWVLLSPLRLIYVHWGLIYAP